MEKMSEIYHDKLSSLNYLILLDFGNYVCFYINLSLHADFS